MNATHVRTMRLQQLRCSGQLVDAPSYDDEAERQANPNQTRTDGAVLSGASPEARSRTATVQARHSHRLRLRPPSLHSARCRDRPIPCHRAFPFKYQRGIELRAFCLLARFSGLRISDLVSARAGSTGRRSTKASHQKTNVDAAVSLPDYVVHALDAVKRKNGYFFWPGTSRKTSVADSGGSDCS